MMGRIHTTGSFRQALSYCLEDKKLSRQQQQSQDRQSSEKEQLSRQQSRAVIFKDRAEILWYNQCFGNRQELTRQFKEVSRLEPNMSKPVFHISLSLPSGERLPKGALVDLASDCARSLGFDKNQYVAILHKDTSQQHLHLVANRVGFDGQTVSDSYSHGKIADFCRAAELRHGLRQELNPRRYLTKEQLRIPRHGLRLDKLRDNIRAALLESRDYPQFEHHMRERGYSVLKGEKGIAFMDEKKVVFKGSEADYPLHTIKATLAKDLGLRQRELQRQDVHRSEELIKQQEQDQREPQELDQSEQQHQQRHLDHGLSL
jgi:hypothetical protein